MQVVRTIGRAFDVCHQLTQQQAVKSSTDEAKNNDDQLETVQDDGPSDPLQLPSKGLQLLSVVVHSSDTVRPSLTHD